jgi:hypothetical protein
MLFFFLLSFYFRFVVHICSMFLYRGSGWAARIYCGQGGACRLMRTETMWDELWYFAGKPFCPGWVHSERECRLPMAMACDMKYFSFTRCLHTFAHGGALVVFLFFCIALPLRLAASRMFLFVQGTFGPCQVLPVCFARFFLLVHVCLHLFIHVIICFRPNCSSLPWLSA